MRLDRQKIVYVTVPEDGTYGKTRYSGSGQIVTRALAEAFAGHAIKVQTAEQRQSYETSIAQAKKYDAGYLVMPIIARWEQRMTEWSGKPSVMAIHLTILDTATGKQIAATSIDGTSRIITWTPTSPESLLHEPLTAYVASIY